MHRAWHSAVGLPSRSTRAPWMLVFVTPPDVRSSFTVPPDSSVSEWCDVQTGDHLATHRCRPSSRDDDVVHIAEIRVALLAASLAVVGLACGDDDGTEATTTTSTTTTLPGPVSSASDESCAARDELQAAISDLSNLDVVRNGTSSVTDALTRIKDAIAEVRSTAGADVQPQVDAFQQSVDQLQTALAGGTSQIGAVVSSIRDVASTGSTLLTSLRNLRCP